MKRYLLVFSTLFATLSAFAQMHHYRFSDVDHHQSHQLTYMKDGITPFEELLVSWNAARPEKGAYEIHVSLLIENTWTPWLFYAHWGADGQKSGSLKLKEQHISICQDTVETSEMHSMTGFKIRVSPKDGASLDNFNSLHVSTSNPSEKKEETTSLTPISNSAIHHRVEGISQMALPDRRGNRLCSPTSTFAVVRHLTQNSALDPIAFAERVWDSRYDIFGNWVFNAAEANHVLLNTKYTCWVEHLDGFEPLLDRLKKGTPVVISIRGPLAGSAQPYTKGHLIAVTGYNSTTDEVICMDPAFESDQKTEVRYPRPDLMKAWARRGNTAYVFSEKSEL